MMGGAEALDAYDFCKGKAIKKSTTGRVPLVGNMVDIQNATYPNTIGDSQLSAEWWSHDAMTERSQ